MSAAVMSTPQKRVLTETTNTRRNILSSPHSAKKRKLNDSEVKNFKAPIKRVNGDIKSSQPKSSFEQDLENLSQNIKDLKDSNSERDQQWARPSLGDFHEKTHALRFQQIEAEESTLHGGRAAIKLFGVTEASWSSPLIRDNADHCTARQLRPPPRH